jgi:hypothetical protein
MGPHNQKSCPLQDTQQIWPTQVHTHLCDRYPLRRLQNTLAPPAIAGGELSPMTISQFVSISASRISSSPVAPASKSLGRASGRVAFPARPHGASLHLRSPAMAAAAVGGNGSPTGTDESPGRFSMNYWFLYLHCLLLRV